MSGSALAAGERLKTTLRGLRPYPKVAITLRRDEHLSIDVNGQNRIPRITSAWAIYRNAEFNRFATELKG